MYEESFKMPFVIQCPGVIEPGSTSEAMAMNVDFAPTLLDFAGLDVPDEMQGESFKPALDGAGMAPRSSVYYHYYEYPKWHKVQPHYGIRTDRYKLMHFYYSMDEWELYDMEADPQEMNNLYAEADPELVATLKAELDSIRRLYGDDGSLDQMKLMTDTVIQRVYTEPSKAKSK